MDHSITQISKTDIQLVSVCGKITFRIYQVILYLNVSGIKRSDKQKICEALLILKDKPGINKQNGDCTNVLKSY